MIFDTALTDLTSTGIFFTWSNQRNDNPISIKLDRTLVNDKWIASYPNSSYKVLSTSISDHSPLIINTNNHIIYAHRFMFKNHWTKYQDFWDALVDIFAVQLEGNPILKLYEKVRNLKVIIKGANWNSSNSIISLIDALTQQQENIQTHIDLDPLNPENHNNLKYINSKLMYYNSMWTTWLKQRAKINWLKHGEEDLKFLYSRIHRRRDVKSSTIDCILTCPSQDRNSKIQDIISYFKAQLNQSNSATADTRHIPIGTGLSSHLVEALIKPVTYEEVKNVVFAGHSNSAPGPDG
ncbi:uncharacterized protein LOC114579733 [Dendrobium catenatum]|uniref:uncharacterized protein LOC114579733 n=1 Tax=Dendrobium catenatum TaxID=906689 RepID=UPI00109EEBAF|nr:uncharacterized protein LOC114579733 [Dendrobium catenatum]